MAMVIHCCVPPGGSISNGLVTASLPLLRPPYVVAALPPRSSSLSLAISPFRSRRRRRRRRLDLLPAAAIRSSLPPRSSDMDSAARALFPLHRCKTLHLVRHAQGIHNGEGEKNHEAYRSYDLFDAHLTPLGWQQVSNLRKHVQAHGLSKKIDLVVTSPLLRTMQTAVGVFGGVGYTGGIDMDSAVTGLYPLHRCKTLHLVRHAQGIHNVEGEKNHEAYRSYDLFDAHLTPLGWQQVSSLRKHVQACGLSKKIDLVVTSPLLRTMQTAVGVFGGEGYTDGIGAPPLMVANAGNSDHPAISSLNCPPFIAIELCREHLGVHPCDKRRSISEYRPLFPAIDFSLIENEDDVLWTPDVREENEEVAVRGMKFLNWLWTREEKEIAIVTHSGFLFHTLKNFGNDFKHFANCQLRSVVIVYKGMTGSDASKTDYPGKIPNGLDLPSDVAEDKH